MKMVTIRCFIIAFLLQALFSAETYGSTARIPHRLEANPSTLFPGFKVSARTFVSLSIKQMEALAGRKLTLRERISFSVMRLKMKHDLKRNPDVQLSDYYGKNANRKLGTGWWILIIILGVVLLAFVLYILAFGGAFS
jgi:hypothetical protein